MAFIFVPGPDGSFKTMSKSKAKAALTNVIISQIDANGITIEKWELKMPWIKMLKFGDLDYENDDLTEIELELRYDWAICDTTNGGGSAPGRYTTKGA